MKRANFENQFKEKIYDHETDVPPVCWEAIEARLPVQRSRRRVLWWIGAGAAAVALVFVTIGLLMENSVKTNRHSELMVKRINHNKLQVVKLKWKEPVVVPVNNIHSHSTKKNDNPHRGHIIPDENNTLVFATATPGNSDTASTIIEDKVLTDNIDKSDEINNLKKEIDAFILDGQPVSNNGDIRGNKVKNERAAIHLMAGLSGESSNQEQNTAKILRTASASTGEITKMLNSSALNEDENPATTRFSIPLSLGLMVEKRIWRKLTIETGLCYSYLRSEQNLNSAPYNGKQIQELHYLGIPVRLGYDIIQLKSTTFYCKAGGRVEKNIAGRWREAIIYNGNEVYSRLERDLEDKLQWSATFSPGINLKLFRNFHIYAETPMSYYIDNHSSIVNIRKARNIEFSLQLGLRAVFTAN